ncbi:MAG: ATP-binding protein [Lachnospiraceae bacterium]|nr:ATP-binding protein [Lachnospiraceae bacterium]
MTGQEKKLRCLEIQDMLEKLPKGKVFFKNIKGKKQPYLQWSENGKSRTKYVKIKERETVFEQLEKRDRLLEELEELRKLPDEPREIMEYDLFRMNVIHGTGLEDLTHGVKDFKKRDCYGKLSRYIRSGSPGKVCILYGLRRTGKTTLLFQLINELVSEERKKAVYIKARVTDKMADLNADLKKLKEMGYRYVMLDEVTLMEDFIDCASILSDIYSMQGMKMILSGTDSLGFWIAEGNELFDRAYMIHTTYIPFREYSRLLGINDIDEYIRYGGTLMQGELEFDDPDALEETSAFRDDESTRRYIDTAICKNIQHSLAYFRYGSNFRHLYDLYEADELTSAINRIIESMNHRFLLSTLITRFKSHDLGSAAQILGKQTDPDKQTDILERIDREAVTHKLMEMLKIRDLEDQKVGITDTHVAEIKEYLKALDLVADCPSETAIQNAGPNEYVLFTQPGMRYCQAQALVHVLMKDRIFQSFSEWEKKLAAEKILEDVQGRMMEDIILLERSRCRQRNERVFKLILSRREYDMVIYNTEDHTCEEYEIKHSTERVPEQSRVLLDEGSNREVEARFGQAVRKCVIYRGMSTVEGEVEYLNAEEYLKSLGSSDR